jgi:hypothetical protein
LEDNAYQGTIATLSVNAKATITPIEKTGEAYERAHGGVICSRREEANELREAIDKRDASAILELMTRQRATFTARDLDRALEKALPLHTGLGVSALDRMSGELGP